MKKELEFEINGNWLTVADFDWFIDKIDAIYVRHSEIGRKSDYAIYIQQGSEIIELYYRTNNEMLIAREYKKLCEAIKEVNPMFDNSIEQFVLINYGNLKLVEGGKNKRFLEHYINLKFENSQLLINGSKKKQDAIIDKLNEIKENNVVL